MQDEPRLDRASLAEALRAAYGIGADALTFIPSFDARAATYRVVRRDGDLFMKIRFEGISPVALEVPAALRHAGVPNVLAPLRTRTGRLWQPLDGASLVVHPFVRGQSAVEVGLSPAQWSSFGASLQAVHGGGFASAFTDRLRVDRFELSGRDLAHRMLALAEGHGGAAGRAASDFAHWLSSHRGRIGRLEERADELAAVLRHRSFDRVLCHGDIHEANILVTDEGGILLVDWDGPVIAPRERDLLFVIGSRVAREVTPDEEAAFFHGYGEADVDADALRFYRYERILEDIGEFAREILVDDATSEATRRSEAQLVAGFFEPGGIAETVEQVDLSRTRRIG